MTANGNDKRADLVSAFAADVSRPSMSPANYRWRLIRIIILAVICRIGMLFYAERAPQKFDFPDSHRYVRVARNIAAGRGPIDSGMVKCGTDPVYPAILALGVKLGCTTDAAVLRFGRMANVLASVLSVALLAGLGRRLLSEYAALIAATILAIDPILLYFNALVLTESIYILTLLIALFAVARIKPISPLSTAAISPLVHALFAGIAFGVGAMTRSTSVLLLFFMIPILWHLLPRDRRISGVAACLAGFLLVLTPNVVRNAQQLGHFVPVRTGGGAALLEALGPWADGGPGMDRIIYPPVPEDTNEYERDRINREAAWKWVRENPGRAATLAVTKAARTWSPMLSAPDHSTGLYQVVSILTVVPVYLLALGGIWLLRRRVWLLFLLLTPAAYFTLVHMVFVGSVRYRVPVMPLVFLLAGVALTHVFRLHTVRPPRRQGAECNH